MKPGLFASIRQTLFQDVGSKTRTSETSLKDSDGNVVVEPLAIQGPAFFLRRTELIRAITTCPFCPW